MTCEEMSERIPEWLAGELGAAELEALREHLASCAGCADEAAAFERLWSELGETEDGAPSVALRTRFDAALAEEMRREARRVVSIESRRRSPRRLDASWLRIAAVAATLLVGILVGSELSERRASREMAALRQEMRSLHETVTVALLADRSSSERLKGIAYGREVSTGDDRVAAALFEAMLNDPDVNVRLAALDALRPRAARADDLPRLVSAVARQDSPLVQLSLIDLLLESGGAAAEHDLARLLDNPNLDPVVRAYLRDRVGRSS